MVQSGIFSPPGRINRTHQSLSGETPATRQDADEVLLTRAGEWIIRSVTGSPASEKMWDLLRSDTEVRTHWYLANYTAVNRLGMNDHGPVHALVATASALWMLRLLGEAGIEPDFVVSGMGTADDAMLIVLAATLLHDIGNQVHRQDHIAHSTMLAAPILDRLLGEIYPEVVQRTRVRAFILSAIHTHHGDPRPLTIEASLVCVGDATDMTTGRARSSYDRGSITIHTVSAMSIDTVRIEPGSDRPIRITIGMSDSAGIYQVQEILAPKVDASPIRSYVEIMARFIVDPMGSITGGITIRDGVCRMREEKPTD